MYFMKSMLHHTLLNESVQTDDLVTIFSVSVIKFPLTVFILAISPCVAPAAKQYCLHAVITSLLFEHIIN